ncbi:unnamed protein product [Phaeothamnion confervicola]
MMGGLSMSSRSLSSYVPEIQQAMRICGSDCRVHMLSNDLTVLNHSAALGLHTAEIKDFSRMGDRFAKIYKHQSVNPVDYERWCFQRWFVILEYFEQLNDVSPVHCVVGLDADILLLKDPAQLLLANVPVDAVEAFHVSHDLAVRSLGAFMYWSLPGLERFTAFLTGVYQAPNPSFIKAGAIHIPGVQPDEFNSQLVPLKDAEGVMWHWSDMCVAVEFMKEDSPRRPRIVEVDVENVDINVGATSPASSMVTVLNGNVHIWQPPGTVIGGGDNMTRRVALIHFQGSSKFIVNDVVLALLRRGWDPTERASQVGGDTSIPPLSERTAACLDSMGEAAAQEQWAVGLCHSLFFFVGGLEALDARFLGDFVADHPVMLRIQSADSRPHGDREGGQHLQTVYPIDALRQNGSEATCGCNWDGCWYTCPALTKTVSATLSNRQLLYESWMQHSAGNRDYSMFVETDPDLLLKFKCGMFPDVSTGVVVVRHPLCRGGKGSPEQWANVWIEFLTRQLPEIASPVWLVRVEDAVRDPTRMREELHAVLGLPVLLSAYLDNIHPLADGAVVSTYKDARSNDDCVALREHPSSWDDTPVAKLASALGYSLDSEEPSERHSILLFSKTELLGISRELLTT